MSFSTWKEMEERAARMSDDELRYAIRDCVETAEIWDRSDRYYGTDTAGSYRDEAAAYRAELMKRAASPHTMSKFGGASVVLDDSGESLELA